MKSLLEKKQEVKMAKPVNVRLPESSHAVLALLAEFTDKSMSELATQAIEDALAKVQKISVFAEFVKQKDGAASVTRTRKAQKVAVAG